MNQTTTDTRTDADRALKARHRAMWASGDYATLASDLIWPLGAHVVEAADVQPGERVLDIAAGSGNAAIRAAGRFADVVASDLTPELFDIGRDRAAEAGVTLDWIEADAESLPFADDAFDVTLSTVGVMFAPHHRLTADELLRVTRPGGRLALINWTPEGFIGNLFRTMKPYAAPLPEGASSPPLWGDQAHVRDLLGDRVTDVSATRHTVAVDRFASGTEFREYFKNFYGPTIAVYARIADDTDAVHALDASIDALASRFGAGSGTFEWEYLLVTARVV